MLLLDIDDRDLRRAGRQGQRALPRQEACLEAAVDRAGADRRPAGPPGPLDVAGHRLGDRSMKAASSAGARQQGGFQRESSHASRETQAWDHRRAPPRVAVMPDMKTAWDGRQLLSALIAGVTTPPPCDTALPGTARLRSGRLPRSTRKPRTAVLAYESAQWVPATGAAAPSRRPSLGEGSNHGQRSRGTRGSAVLTVGGSQRWRADGARTRTTSDRTATVPAAVPTAHGRVHARRHSLHPLDDRVGIDVPAGR